MPQQRTESAMETRQSLILTALQLFGEKGFEATTTREIAAAAGANIGSISYHFGGKEGLHAACAEFIVATMRSVIGATFDIDAPDAETKLDRDEARRRLSQLSGIMIDFLTARPEAAAHRPLHPARDDASDGGAADDLRSGDRAGAQAPLPRLGGRHRRWRTTIRRRCCRSSP